MSSHYISRSNNNNDDDDNNNMLNAVRLHQNSFNVHKYKKSLHELNCHHYLYMLVLRLPSPVLRFAPPLPLPITEFLKMLEDGSLDQQIEYLN